MKRFQKISNAMFLLVVFAVASVAALAAARYYGNMTVWDALLLAFGATAGPAMAVATILFRRRQR